ncbi:hypothetical protein AB0L56_08440 [Streptomyces sp. NPDC052079]|uniref:hypothetical protein n=1 Tax=Streptomyces sp. NPDC052079 TaxID=3155526 RepID=UPI0034173BF0
MAADEKGPAMTKSSEGATVVALLADPDAPTEVAQRIARRLPDRLAKKSGEERQFDVTVVSEPITAGAAEDPPTVMRRIMERANGEDWDIVVALTDLPLHSHGRKLVVDLSYEYSLALLSLPSLGGWRQETRALRAVEKAVLSLAGRRDAEAEEETRGAPPQRPFDEPLAPVRPDPFVEDESADLRYITGGPRGNMRVLVGMVRANRPWRLVPGLSKGLAAALATGAVATVNGVIWSLAVTLSTPRLVIAMVGSVALMTGWLIVDAHLWHRKSEVSPEAWKRAVLYNASTVLTVGIGVLVCYVGLLVINLAWAYFILTGQVFTMFARTPLRAGEYLTLAWLVASVATVGGALGSSLESDEAIRAAAYSKREQQRRERLQKHRGD